MSQSSSALLTGDPRDGGAERADLMSLFTSTSTGSSEVDSKVRDLWLVDDEGRDEALLDGEDRAGDRGGEGVGEGEID